MTKIEVHGQPVKAMHTEIFKLHHLGITKRKLEISTRRPTQQASLLLHP